MARKDKGRSPERDGSLLESYDPSRNTGQGDCCHGEPNLSQRGGEGKPNSHSSGEAKDLKGSLVMAVRLETGRSILGQDEGGRKPTGGLQGS